MKSPVTCVEKKLQRAKDIGLKGDLGCVGNSSEVKDLQMSEKKSLFNQVSPIIKNGLNSKLHLGSSFMKNPSIFRSGQSPDHFKYEQSKLPLEFISSRQLQSIKPSSRDQLKKRSPFEIEEVSSLEYSNNLQNEDKQLQNTSLRMFFSPQTSKTSNFMRYLQKYNLIMRQPHATLNIFQDYNKKKSNLAEMSQRDPSNRQEIYQQEDKFRQNITERNTHKLSASSREIPLIKKQLISNQSSMLIGAEILKRTRDQAQDVISILKQDKTLSSKYNSRFASSKLLNMDVDPIYKANYTWGEEKINFNSSLNHATGVSSNTSQEKSTHFSTFYEHYLDRIKRKQGTSGERLKSEQLTSSYVSPSKSQSHETNLLQKEKECEQGNHKQTKENKNSNEVQLPKLKFPASQKELQEFNKAQLKNEFRFARVSLNVKKTIFLEDEKQINTNANAMNQQGKNALVTKNFGNFKRGADSLRIQELVRERNEVIRTQKDIQIRSTQEQEKLQSVQCEEMVQESTILAYQQHPRMISGRNIIDSPQYQGKQGRNLHISPIHRKFQKEKSPNSLALTGDALEMSKFRQILPTPNVKSIQRNRSMNNFNRKSNLYMSCTDTCEYPQLTLDNGQKIGTKGLVSLNSIENYMDEESSETDMEKDLVRETHFVNYLQQNKIYLKEALENYLQNRHKLLKAIQKNCLMDLEQFVFFIMNFYQFCIDDMFDEFKYEMQLSSCINISSGYCLERQVPTSGTNRQSPSFKFSQKIPEDIMGQILEFMNDYLSPKDFVIEKKDGEDQLQDFFSSALEEQKRIAFGAYPMNTQTDKHLQIANGQKKKFLQNMQRNVQKYILPQTIIDRMGGFVRLRQLIQEGIVQLNNQVNTASKMNLIEENDDNLIDKHLMPSICALINEDKETLMMQIHVFKQHNNQLSYYDFFTIKKIVWEIMGSIKLDHKIKYFLILQIENLRSEFFDNPFQHRLKELGYSLMKSYELCNYFRNPTPADNSVFLSSMLLVLYKNASFSEFHAANQQKLKFALNYRFFDYLQRFLLEELHEFDSKSILDIKIRMNKLRIKAGVVFNMFSLVSEDSEQFFNSILTFLQVWMQKYNLSNTLMDAKAMDFKFLELFLKWTLNKQDLYSVLDSEPSFIHFSVNEFMINFWIKGIVAFFDDQLVPKNQYNHLISFISLYLLFKDDDSKQSLSTNNSIIQIKK